MIEIRMHEVDVNLVTSRETGMRTMRLRDEQSGIIVRLDFQEDAARMLAGALTGTPVEIVPASAMPREVQH